MKNKISPKSEVRSPKVILVFIMLLTLDIGHWTLDCLYGENKVITDIKKWEYVETEHFKIYHYPECKELLPVISEILEDTFNNTTRFYEYRPSKKIPFFIYRNHN